MRSELCVLLTRLLYDAIDELEVRPHAVSVEEITGLLATAEAFRMYNAANRLRESLRIAQSTVAVDDHTTSPAE
jgi:hypothetical protein